MQIGSHALLRDGPSATLFLSEFAFMAFILSLNIIVPRASPREGGIQQKQEPHLSYCSAQDNTWYVSGPRQMPTE